MTETARIFLLLAISTAGAAGAILAIRPADAAEHWARGFFWLCAIPAAAVFLERAGIAAGWLARLQAIESGYALIRWVVLGVAAASALLLLRTRAGAPPFARSPWTLRGLCVFTALSYLGIEAGKLAHDAEMREFFTASGYPVRMMYAVMVAEILGAVGLLVPPTRVFAGVGLSVLLLGAIGTHARNGDPFSDSLDAVRILVLVAAIVRLSSRGRRAQRGGRGIPLDAAMPIDQPPGYERDPSLRSG